VAIARALVNEPALILADEPTGNLDTRTGDEMVQLFLTLNREQKQTFIIVSHARKVADLADRVYHMSDGSIVNVVSRERGTAG
jgi:putative ABC transport system ATP-binding protein